MCPGLSGIILQPPFPSCGSHLRKLIARPGMVPEMHVEPLPGSEMHARTLQAHVVCNPNSINGRQHDSWRFQGRLAI